MIPPEVIVVPAVFGIPAAVLFARMWFRHKERMAGLSEGSDRAGGASAGQSAMLEERLTRIEQAVDAIAVEVERMGEGQRFVTKLLAERDAPALSAGIGAASRNDG